MILFTFENDSNTAIKTETFTSAREQFTCSDVIPTYLCICKYVGTEFPVHTNTEKHHIPESTFNYQKSLRKVYAR